MTPTKAHLAEALAALKYVKDRFEGHNADKMKMYFDSIEEALTLVTDDAVREALLRRIALLESQLAPHRNEWQKIETAPNNTKVLLYVCNAFLHGHVKTGVVNPDFYEPGIFSYYDEGEACGMLPELYATHWQPLPSAPVADNGGEV